jgi:hypothetical protein
MAAVNRTPQTARGLVIPDPKLKYAQFESSLSTVTQAGPLPGVPAPQQDTDMVLEASGSQSADKRLRIQSLKAGMPGPDEGGFVWSYVNDTNKRGWEPPQTIAHWEPIDWTTTSGTWRTPCAVRTSNQTVIVAVQKGGGEVSSWSRNPSTGVWTEVEVFAHGTYAFAAKPCLCVLPSGRVLLFFWVEDADLDLNQIRSYYTDDHGATWTLMNQACLRTPLDTTTYTPGRLRAAYSNNQILLVAHVVWTAPAWDDVFVQYAATDQGANFSVVSTWKGGDRDQSGAYQEIVARDGQFLFAYLRREDGTTDVKAYLRRISNAFEALATAEEIEIEEPGSSISWGEMAGGAFTLGDLAFWADDDGVLYALGRDHDTGGGATYELYLVRSTDGGDTWEKMGVGGGAAFGCMVFNNDDVDRYLFDFCAVPVQGRTVLIHRAVANPSNYGASLMASFLGGYTTVNLPALYGYPIANQRVAWEWMWLPFEDPADVAGVTLNNIGAGTTNIAGTGWVTLTTGAGESRSWEITPAASSLEEGLLVLRTVRRVSGAGDTYIEATLGVAGPNDYKVRVNVDTTSIELFDMNGVVRSLGSVTTTDAAAADGVQILIALNNPTGTGGNDGAVKAWYRPATSDPDREWTEIGSADDLVDGTTATTSLIEWGNTDAAVSQWRLAAHSSDQFTGQQLTDYANPTNLFPRSFSPNPVYVDDGVLIAARRGPCLMNEVWIIATRYEHGIENAHPDVCPSPARRWWTTGETQQEIVWEYDGDLDQEVPPLSPTVALYLGDINFRTGSLWGYDKDTAAYVKLCDIDTATGQSTLRYVRQGNRLIVDTGTAHSANEYFTHNALAGAHFRLSGGGAVTRAIAGNTGGAWTSATTKRPVLTLDGVTSGDPTSGNAGAIWARDCCVLVSNATKYTRYKLIIDAQDTAEGYFYAGVILLGYFVPFARTYSFGRQQTWTPNNEIVTHLSGARTVTNRGPVRRSVTFQWIDGVVTTQIGMTQPTPDYTLPYTGATAPIGAPAETPYLVAGLLDELHGAEVPVVYLPNVPLAASSSTVTTVLNRNKMLYGRVVSPVTTQTLVGHEWNDTKGELLTVEAITIEEEV